MIFSSYIFLLAFLPVTLIVYFGIAKYVPSKVQRCVLILASLFFYGYANVYYLPLLIGSILVNYLVASSVENRKEETAGRKLIFVLGIIANVGLLGYFKYKNFFIENINELFHTDFNLTRIIIPLGLSFFTFQQIVYLINVWKKEEKVPSLIDYTQFVTFFPHVTMGPIIIAKDVRDQYKDEKNRHFDINNFTQGLFIFILGLFKKVVIADSIAGFANNGYTHELGNLSFGGAWLVSIAYTLQIFFDFSGYSDMAIGAAKMFNINLPVNFYSPYKSKSITEFWKRWHITLGRALATIVYFPLGGNRKGYARTCFNLLMVFFISGLWHGETWPFIVWGLMHGVLRVFEKILEKQFDKVPNVIRIAFTFLYVNTAWVLFRAPNWNDAMSVLKKMYLPDTISFDGLNRLANDTILTYPASIETTYLVAFLSILLAIVFFYKKNSTDLYKQFKPTVKNAIFIAILLCISILHLSKAASFIYFNF